jgi:hypothetical protein
MTLALGLQSRISDSTCASQAVKVWSMKRFTPMVVYVVVCALALLAQNARATEIEVFGAAGAFPFTIGVALRNLIVANNPDISLEATATNRWALAGIGVGNDLGPVGRFSVQTRFAFVYSGGVRLRLNARGTFGPVAADFSGLYWSVPPDATNPMVTFEKDSDPFGNNGFLLSANLGYRLSRVLIVSVGGRYSTAGSRVGARLEYREGEITLYGGPQFAFQDLGNQNAGVTYAGVIGGKYAPENDPYTIGGELLLGWGPIGGGENVVYGLNFDFSTDLPDNIGTLGAYVALEPWRLDVYPLRFGASFVTPLGPGQLYTRLGGGTLLGGVFQWGVQLGYVLFLDELLSK